MNREAFFKWVQELDDRCTEHLRRNPDTEQKLLSTGLPDPMMIDEARTMSGPVMVTESLHFPGAWCVFCGATKLTTFFGETAHQRASKFAGDILADR